MLKVVDRISRVCFVLGLFILPINIEAQSVQSIIQDPETPVLSTSSSLSIDMPSPTAASIMKFSTIPVNYSTGVPDISIPLHEAKIGDISIPLTLQYNASGVRPSELPGWVGLGWALNIGVVSRVVHGLPDDSDNGYWAKRAYNEAYQNKTLHTVEPGYDENNYMEDVAGFHLDAEPDVFTVSAPGLSLSFMAKDENTVVLFPHKNVDVDISVTNGNITQITVKKEDGTTYVFSEVEYTYTEDFEKSGWGSQIQKPSQSFISSWYLTEIRSKTGKHELTVAYDSSLTPVEYTVIPVKTSTYQFVAPDNENEEGCSNPTESITYRIKKDKIYTRFPSSIITPTENIRFRISEASMFDSTNAIPATIKYTLLDRIEIEDKFYEEIDKEINLSYNNFFLNDVVVKDESGNEMPPYIFDYYTPGNFPGYGTYNIDHWGYYNGAVNTDLIPDIQSYNPDFEGIDFLEGANREPNINFTKVGSLERINYPTGGSATFHYEANDYYFDSVDDEKDGNYITGGLRIKKIVLHDGISIENDIVKEYRYVQKNDELKSSGLRLPEDNLFIPYDYSKDFDPQDEDKYIPPVCPYVVRSAGIQGIMGPSVSYKEVKEIVLKSSENQGYSYYDLSYSAQTGKKITSFKRGKILGSHVYNSSDEKQVENTNHFEFEGFRVDDLWGVEVVLVERLTHYNVKIFRPKSFNYVSFFMYQDFSSTIVKDPGQDSSVASSVEFEYKLNDTDKNIYQLDLKTETNSDGTKRVTKYEYAYEAESEMLDSNMVSQPFAVTVYDEEENFLNRKTFEWSNILGNDKWSIWKFWDFKSETDSVNTIRVNSYDVYGNPIAIKKGSDSITNYFYGSNTNACAQDSNGISGIKGVYLTCIQNTIQGETLSTKAKYNVLGLLTSLESPDGVVGAFEYGDFQRLETVKNNADQIVSEYTYTYTGDNFSATSPNWIETRAFDSLNTRKSRQYFDGLGRLIQGISLNGSQSPVSAIEYDAVGREWKSYKPYFTGSINFDHNYVQNVNNAYPNDTAYTKVIFEESPLSRVLETIPLGGKSDYGSVTTLYSIETVDDKNYSVTTTTDPEGKVTKTYIDAWGRTTRTVSDPEGINAITEFEYDALNQLKEVRPPNYFAPPSDSTAEDWIISYNYDKRGNLISATSNDFGTRKYAYDSIGRLRFSQDAKQAASETVAFTTYDELGRIKTTGIGDYSGDIINLEADSVQPFETIVDNWILVNAWDDIPDNSVFPYNEMATSLYNYAGTTNAKGKLVAEMYRFGGNDIPSMLTVDQTLYTGDETVVAADDITIGNSIIENGSTITIKAGNQIVLEDGFQAENGASVVVKTDAALLGTAGQGVTDVAGANPWQLTLYNYDTEGRVSTKYVFIGNNRDWDAQIDYQYNWLGELVRRRVKMGEDELYFHYEYDLLGQLSEVTMTTDGTVDTESPEIEYSYLADGLLDEKEFSGSTLMDYGYDIQGRLTSINNTESSSTPFAAAYSYFKNGNIENAEFRNPLTSLGSNHYRYKYEHTYDGLNRLKSAGYFNYSGGSWVNNILRFGVLGINYDPQGNISSLIRYDDSGTMVDNLTYSYSSSNRLNGISDAVNTTAEPWDAEDATFGYDANGNMNFQSGKFNQLAYDYRNQPTYIETIGGDKMVANYNSAGARIIKEFNGAAGTYTYYLRDGDETLATVNESGNLNVNLIGNGIEGQLLGGIADPVINTTGIISSETESNDTQTNADGPIGLTATGLIGKDDYDWFYFDVLRSGTVTLNVRTDPYDAQVHPEEDLVWHVYDTNGYVADGEGVESFSVSAGRYYMKVYPSQGMVFENYSDYFRISMSAEASDEYATRYFLKDHLGSTRAIVDETGTHLASYDYYPFGLTMPGRSSNSANPNDNYKFTGYEHDDEAGINLYHANARGYDPVLGRFMQIDPLASERSWVSPYNYVQNNPLNRIDPTGLLDDYAYNKETGELTLIRETDDDYDRIVKTDKDGNVKRKGDGPLGFLVRKSKRGDAKVAVDKIEKGILKDGMNLKENNGSFAVNGEGQPSLEGFDRFISEFSDYIDTEIAGVRLGDANSNSVSRVLTYKYKDNTRTTSATPESWFTRYGDLLKGHFHTHPFNDHTPSKRYDMRIKAKFPNVPFYIIAGGHAKQF